MPQPQPIGWPQTNAMRRVAGREGTLCTSLLIFGWPLPGRNPLSKATLWVKPFVTHCASPASLTRLPTSLKMVRDRVGIALRLRASNKVVSSSIPAPRLPLCSCVAAGTKQRKCLHNSAAFLPLPLSGNMAFAQPHFHCGPSLLALPPHALTAHSGQAFIRT